MEKEGQIQILENALKRLRSDALLILSKIDLPADLEEVDEILREEEWLAGPDEHAVIDLIRSLAIIATALRPDVFGEAIRLLIRVLKDDFGEDEWEVNDHED
ncbi:MAG: hypothetical protein ACE5H4_01760 [Candidatus Thorarchaeota archaeon]